MLSMPQNIGGRFSVFTNIGLFPLSGLSVDLQGLLRGYKQGLLDKESILKLTSFLYQGILDHRVSVYSFQYRDSLKEWGLWLQQLWSESLSKATQLDGATALALPTVVPCRGVSDQHSVLQQVIEGIEKKYACFHLIEDVDTGLTIQESHFENSLMLGKSLGRLLDIEARATRESMDLAGVPTILLATSQKSAESLAYLMTLWMVSVGVLGELMNLDAFNQPGVESGKVITRRVLARP